MNAAKRKLLSSAGWTFGDAADFPGMSEGERQRLDDRFELALAIRRRRAARRMSKKKGERRDSR